jgi:hypothetical protein
MQRFQDCLARRRREALQGPFKSGGSRRRLDAPRRPFFYPPVRPPHPAATLWNLSASFDSVAPVPIWTRAQNVTILISYSQEQPEAGRAVADYLRSNGRPVRENAPAPEDTIWSTLESASAAIVIWTPDCDESEWMKANFKYADQARKLILLYTRDLGLWQIPKPRDACPRIAADDYARILLAVEDFEEGPPSNESVGEARTASAPSAPSQPPRKPARKAGSKSENNIKIKSRAQVIQYSRILIAALEEVVEYDPARHHNQAPPELRIDDDDYLREIRNLIAELRTLNSLLAATRRQPKKEAGVIVNLSHHFDAFLDTYAKSLGKGVGWLTIGVIASLLYQSGIGENVITNILNHVKIQR